MSTDSATTTDLAVYTRLSLVATAWGGTFVAGRYISHSIHPMLSASVRFLLASAALTLFLALSGRGFKRLNPTQLLKVILLGGCGIFAYSIFFFRGLQHIDASRASLIVALNPAVMAILSYVFYRERLTLQRVMGIVLCFVGVAIVVVRGNPETLTTASGGWLGESLIFGCVLSWTAYSVFCKTVVHEIGPLHTVTYSIYAGTVMLLLFSVTSGDFDMTQLRAISLSGFLSLCYLGFIGSAVAYIWYYDGIRRIGATRSGVFIALNPLAGVLLGALLLGEPLSWPVLIGGALIVGGIVACNRMPALQKYRTGVVLPMGPAPDASSAGQHKKVISDKESAI